MKKILLPMALLVSSVAFAKVNVSGYMTPTIVSGADTASTAHTNTINLKNAAIEFEGEINKGLSGTFVLWANQDFIDNNSYSVIDEVYLTQKIMDGYIKVGKSYLSFGDAGSSFISYTDIYNSSSTQADMLEAGYSFMGLTLKAYAYKAAAWEKGDKEGINASGAQLEYTNKMLDLKLGYRTNIAAKFGKTGAIEKDPGAYIASAKVNYMGAALFAEYFAVASAFDVADISYEKDSVATKVNPTIANIELTYTMPVKGKDLTIGAGYQMSSEVADGNGTLKPSQVITAGINYAVDENATLMLEHRQATDEKSTKGGQTDGHTACKTTLGYALSF